MNTSQKIYIAGPMTGIPNYNRDAFNNAAKEWGAMGYVVLNPAILPEGLTQADYMDITIAMVRCCDVVFMLKAWRKSEGAVAEHALAVKLGKQIIQQYKGEICS